MVELRAVATDDVPRFFENQLDPEALAMAAWPSRDHAAHVAHWDMIFADPTIIARTIVADGSVAGDIVSWSEAEHRAVGYWLDRRFWGRGIATRALAAFLELDRERPLEAHAARANLGSIRVLEKCGFVRIREEVAQDGVEEVLFRLEARTTADMAPP